MAIENDGKRPPLGWLLVGAAIALAGAVLLKGYRPRPSAGIHAAGGLQIGLPAPDFELTYPAGSRTLLSQLKGKAVLLNFWASWCEPCMEEMESLAGLEKALHDQPFLLLALNADGEAPGGRAIRRRTMPANLVYDFSPDVLTKYEVSSIPLSVLIDTHGIVREIFLGPRDWTSGDMLRLIESASH